ncbi:MAG: hypothetical protein Q4F65_11660 [Propionibacteriaceae bacterium]|nr:hypothetical protein [Propionibacteriaceae bacterium]
MNQRIIVGEPHLLFELDLSENTLTVVNEDGATAYEVAWWPSELTDNLHDGDVANLLGASFTVAVLLGGNPGDIVEIRLGPLWNALEHPWPTDW